MNTCAVSPRPKPDRKSMKKKVKILVAQIPLGRRGRWEGGGGARMGVNNCITVNWQVLVLTPSAALDDERFIQT